MTTATNLAQFPPARESAGIFDPIRDLGPPELMDLLEQLAGLLPDDLRLRLRRVVETAGRAEDPLQRVLEVVRAQWEGLRAGDRLQVAVVGPARTGKSTLLAAIGEGDPDRAAALFNLVDLQGLDEYLGYGRRDRPLAELESADLVLLVLDGARGFTAETVRLVQQIQAANPSLLLVLNRIDLVNRARQTVQQARREFRLPVVATSARRPETIQRLLRAIVAACPRALYPLAQHLPAFRRALCRGIVSQAAFGAGLVAGIPIPVGDVLPVSAIQVAMVLKIARAHGFPINRERARELVPMLAAGLLVREGSRKLCERYPEKRGLISVVAAGGWTSLMGSAAVRYFERMSRALERERV